MHRMTDEFLSGQEVARDIISGEMKPEMAKRGMRPAVVDDNNNTLSEENEHKSESQELILNALSTLR